MDQFNSAIEKESHRSSLLLFEVCIVLLPLTLQKNKWNFCKTFTKQNVCIILIHFKCYLPDTSGYFGIFLFFRHTSRSSRQYISHFVFLVLVPRWILGGNLNLTMRGKQMKIVKHPQFNSMQTIIGSHQITIHDWYHE